MRRNAMTEASCLVTNDRNYKAETLRFFELMDRFWAGGPSGCTNHPHFFFGRLTPLDGDVDVFALGPSPAPVQLLVRRSLPTSRLVITSGMSQRQRYCGCGGRIGMLPLDLSELLHDAAIGLTIPMANFSLIPHRHRPEPNSSRLTSLKSTCFDSPANNVGPWPASLAAPRTRTHRSSSSANASGSFTPATNSPLPDSRLSC